jgi:hypothetical protein
MAVESASEFGDGARCMTQKDGFQSRYIRQGRRALFRESKAFGTGAEMPFLVHKPGEDFDWRASEVFQWLATNPVMLQYLFDRLRESGAIVYDRKKGGWRGTGASRETTQRSGSR